MFYFINISNRKKIILYWNRHSIPLLTLAIIKWAQAAPNHQHLFLSVKHEDWSKLVKIWRCFTELPAKRQGSALVLLPKDKALDAVLETNESEIAGENGVVTIITRLNHLLKTDCTITKYHTFESFMTFKISFVMFIQDFLNEFDKHLFKTKTYGTAMSDNIFAYHFRTWIQPT